MNMENTTSEKKAPEPARTGAASTAQADTAKMSQAAYVAARTPLGLLLGGLGLALAWSPTIVVVLTALTWLLVLVIGGILVYFATLFEIGRAHV